MIGTTGMRIRDTILWVDDTREADLPAVVCLHSLWLDGSMFDALVDAARGRYRIIRPDFRGQGRSAPATSEIVTMEDCAEDIEALIDALGLRGVHVVAQSMGGDVALRLAAKRPDQVASLTLLGSSARGEPADQLAWIEQWLDGAAKERGFKGENLDTLMSVMFGETTMQTESRRATLDHWRSRMAACSLSLWPAMLGVAYRKGVVDLLPGIAAPTLIISGTEDMPRPPAWADEVAAGLPDARLVRLDKVGHSPTLEAPERVIPEILGFLDERNAGAR